MFLLGSCEYAGAVFADCFRTLWAGICLSRVLPEIPTKRAKLPKRLEFRLYLEVFLKKTIVLGGIIETTAKLKQDAI